MYNFNMEWLYTKGCESQKGSGIVFEHVDQLKRELDAKRPLPSGMVKNLREVIRIEWTYNSNAIEGNTLSLLETKMVVEEGLTIGGKRLAEHLEAVNHAEAIDFVEQLVSEQEVLTARVLKQIHYLVLKNIDDENAGRYRGYDVEISGSAHRPIHHVKVQEAMDELFAWYEQERSVLHPVELASRFHFQFVYIHPFADGNGRTARLLMNLILMQNGYPPAIIKVQPEQRLRYYETLETARVQGDVGSFVELVRDSVEESLYRYLKALGV